MINNSYIAQEVVNEDMRRIAERASREKTICINPACFDDTCRGECEEEDDESCPCGGLCD